MVNNWKYRLHFGLTYQNWSFSISLPDRDRDQVWSSSSDRNKVGFKFDLQHRIWSRFHLQIWSGSSLICIVEPDRYQVCLGFHLEIWSGSSLICIFTSTWPQPAWSYYQEMRALADPKLKPEATIRKWDHQTLMRKSSVVVPKLNQIHCDCVVTSVWSGWFCNYTLSFLNASGRFLNAFEHFWTNQKHSKAFRSD